MTEEDAELAWAFIESRRLASQYLPAGPERDALEMDILGALGLARISGREEEREACAAICAAECGPQPYVWQEEMADNMATKIRARGGE